MIEQAADRCRRASIPRAIYEPSLRALEMACVQHVIAESRQTVAHCRDPGTRVMAQRQQITPQGMRKRRGRALAVLSQVATDQAQSVAPMRIECTPGTQPEHGDGGL